MLVLEQQQNKIGTKPFVLTKEVKYVVSEITVHRAIIAYVR